MPKLPGKPKLKLNVFRDLKGAAILGGGLGLALEGPGAVTAPLRKMKNLRDRTSRGVIKMADGVPLMLGSGFGVKIGSEPGLTPNFAKILINAKISSHLGERPKPIVNRTLESKKTPYVVDAVGGAGALHSIIRGKKKKTAAKVRIRGRGRGGKGFFQQIQKAMQGPGRGTRALRELAGVPQMPAPFQTAASVIGVTTGIGALGALGMQSIEHATQAAHGMTRKLHYRRMLAHDPKIMEEFPEETIATTFDVFHSIAPSLATHPDLAARSVRTLMSMDGGVDWRNAQELARTQDAINKARAIRYAPVLKTPGVANIPIESFA